MSEGAGAGVIALAGFVRRRLGRVSLIGALAIAAAGSAWVVHQRGDTEWQHGGDRVHVSATIVSTSPTRLGSVLAALNSPPARGVDGASQMLALRVRWNGTPGADGSYNFILLDNRLAPPMPLRAYDAWGPHGEGFGPHWSGAYETLSAHYPWLARTASRMTGGGWTNDSDAFGLPAEPTGAGTLTYWIGKSDLPTTAPSRDLTLAMVYVGANGEVQWAKKVPLAGAL